MNLSVRPATKEDIPTLAEIHLTSKLEAESGIIDQIFLDTKTPAEYEEKWARWLNLEYSRTLIAHDDTGTACALVSYGKLQTPPPGSSPIRPAYTSEIFALYVLPAYQRQGIGRFLLSRASAELTKNGHRSLCLWALQKNKDTCAFYTALNGQRLGKRQVEMGPSDVREVCFGWRDLTPLMTD